MIDTPSFWLREGKFTREEGEVGRTVGGIFIECSKNGERFREEISNFISNNLRRDMSKKDKEYRNRTAAEIIESGYWNGCTDRALVFVTLARCFGIPTKYIETFDEEWVADPDMKHIKGHIFAEIMFDDGRWRVYDPVKGFLREDYVLGKRRFVEFGKGLDFSELYVKENGVYRSRPINLQVIDEKVLEVLKK